MGEFYKNNVRLNSLLDPNTHNAYADRKTMHKFKQGSKKLTYLAVNTPGSFWHHNKVNIKLFENNSQPDYSYNGDPQFAYSHTLSCFETSYYIPRYSKLIYNNSCAMRYPITLMPVPNRFKYLIFEIQAGGGGGHETVNYSGGGGGSGSFGIVAVKVTEEVTIKVNRKVTYRSSGQKGNDVDIKVEKNDGSSFTLTFKGGDAGTKNGASSAAGGVAPSTQIPSAFSEYIKVLYAENGKPGGANHKGGTAISSYTYSMTSNVSKTYESNAGGTSNGSAGGGGGASHFGRGGKGIGGYKGENGQGPGAGGAGGGMTFWDYEPGSYGGDSQVKVYI